MHARFYASSMGRFLRPDPAMKSAKCGNPQSWNRYSYVENNPIVYVDPTGEVINLAKLTSVQQGSLLEGLKEFTGNEYKVDKKGNLQLVSVGENSSATATDFLNKAIGDEKVYGTESVEGRNKWNNGNVELNFSSFEGADYGKVDPRTFNLGSTFIHELFHGVTGIMDNDPITGAVHLNFGFKGPAVEFVNKIREERGMPQRESYGAEPAGKGKVKYRFDHVDPKKPDDIFYVIRKML